jgi:zinc transport system substrate-binding protein
VRTLLLLAATALIPAFAGCAQPPDGLQVAATSYPVAFVVGWIGSGHVQVHAIVPAGAQVEGWTPDAHSTAALNGTRLLFYNGAGLEPWAFHLTHHGSLAGVDVADGLNLVPLETGNENLSIPEAPGADGPHHHDASHLHGGELDAHVWLDPRAMDRMGQNAAHALATADPDHASDYTRRAAELTQTLDGLRDRYLRGVRQCATRHMGVASAEYGYLYGAFDLFQHVVANLTPDAAPPTALAAATHLAREYSLTHITFDRSPSANVTLALAAIGLRVAVVHPLGSLSAADLAAGRNYFTVMNDNLAVMRSTMRCT